MNKHKVEKVRREIGFAGSIAVESRGHSGGLALFWRNEGGCMILETNMHFIDLK